MVRLHVGVVRMYIYIYVDMDRRYFKSDLTKYILDESPNFIHTYYYNIIISMHTTSVFGYVCIFRRMVCIS